MREKKRPPKVEWSTKSLSWDVAMFLDWYRREQVYRREEGLELMKHFEVKRGKKK